MGHNSEKNLAQLLMCPLPHFAAIYCLGFAHMLSGMALLREKDEFYKAVSPYISEELMDKVSVSNTTEEEKEIVSQIEDTLYNNYLVLPLIFYNDSIAVNNSIENIKLDGNGNLKFEMTKNN